jgi:dihydrofolate synthase/folylpolyglutamate synthase
LRGETVPASTVSVSASLSVPGRFEVVSRNPTVILDSANNPDGAAHLAAELKRVLEQQPGARLILVLGILADKDFRAMIAHLAPLATVVIATQSSSPRACSAETVAEEARRYTNNVETVVPVQAALKRATQLSLKRDVVCVTGSFYTIAESSKKVLRDV